MTTPAELWPWLALAGLGLYHGINPAMGWLFAVALGLNRGSQRVVLVSLVPIALGHAAAVAIVVTIVLALGLIVDPRNLMRLAGIVLIGWALWHAAYGHRRRVRVGMQAGLAGLALWSFLMATAHGAGLMLFPFLVNSGHADSLEQALSGNAAAGALAVAVHTGAMLAVTALAALAVYETIGVGILRSAWINLDRLWAGALLAGAVATLLV